MANPSQGISWQIRNYNWFKFVHAFNMAQVHHFLPLSVYRLLVMKASMLSRTLNITSVTHNLQSTALTDHNIAKSSKITWNWKKMLCTSYLWQKLVVSKYCRQSQSVSFLLLSKYSFFYCANCWFLQKLRKKLHQTFMYTKYPYHFPRLILLSIIHTPPLKRHCIQILPSAMHKLQYL